MNYTCNLRGGKYDGLAITMASDKIPTVIMFDTWRYYRRTRKPYLGDADAVNNVDIIFLCCEEPV